MNQKGEKTRAEKVAATRTRMTELAAKFVDRSDSELAALRAALTALATGDTHALAEIRHLAHRMAGTGATLGLERLSDRALDLEHLAERQAPGTPPEAATLRQFDAAFRALESELRKLEARAP